MLHIDSLGQDYSGKDPGQRTRSPSVRKEGKPDTHFIHAPGSCTTRPPKLNRSQQMPKHVSEPKPQDNEHQAMHKVVSPPQTKHSRLNRASILATVVQTCDQFSTTFRTINPFRSLSPNDAQKAVDSRSFRCLERRRNSNE